MSPSPALEKAKSDLKMVGRWVLALFLIVSVATYLVKFGISYRGWIAFSNSIAIEDVLMEPKPHDCEWGSAPLGSKHCHYDSHVSEVDGKVSDSKIKIVVAWEKVSE